MVEQIGNNAGILWNILNEQDNKMEVAKLKKAIGWLAREEKLVITNEKKGKKTTSYIALK